LSIHQELIGVLTGNSDIISVTFLKFPAGICLMNVLF